MPKSKVRSKTEYTQAAASNRTPVKVSSNPTPRWYLTIMFGFLLIGLLWLVTYYLIGDRWEWMANLGNWQNFAIGFGLMIVGLLMTMRWRG